MNSHLFRPRTTMITPTMSSYRALDIMSQEPIIDGFHMFTSKDLHDSEWSQVIQRHPVKDYDRMDLENTYEILSAEIKEEKKDFTPPRLLRGNMPLKFHEGSYYQTYIFPTRLLVMVKDAIFNLREIYLQMMDDGIGMFSLYGSTLIRPDQPMVYKSAIDRSINNQKYLAWYALPVMKAIAIICRFYYDMWENHSGMVTSIESDFKYSAISIEGLIKLFTEELDLPMTPVNRKCLWDFYVRLGNPYLEHNLSESTRQRIRDNAYYRMMYCVDRLQNINYANIINMLEDNSKGTIIYSVPTDVWVEILSYLTTSRFYEVYTNYGRD